MTTAASERVEVYSVGLCAASACAPEDTPREDIEAAVNRAAPTGISSPWRISDEPAFADGTPMPCPCRDAQGRQHWLLNC